MVISLQSLVCLRVTLHTSLCVLVTIGRARNRQLPWKQSVVDIGFNSVHYQVRPTKITITAEMFYDNRHGNRWARGHGAWFNSCLYTHIHILTYTHQQLMVFLINLVSLIPFWVLRFFFLKQLQYPKNKTMIPFGLQMTTSAFGELWLIFWKVTLFVETGRIQLCIPSLRDSLGEAQGSDNPNNTPVRCPQKTSEDTLFSKYFLPRTTEVRVNI